MGNSSKRKALIRMITFALGVFLMFSEMYAIRVDAGSSDHVVDKNSFAEQLDATKWSVPNEDVLVSDGTIRFDKSSTSDTKIITVNPAKISAYHEELFRAKYTFVIHDIPKGKKFIVAFSLTGIESGYEEAGNLELVFENKQGMKATVLAYDEQGEEIVLAKQQSCGVRLGAKVTVNVYAATDNKVQVAVNGNNLYEGIAPIDMEGRIGFLQSGGCQVTISNAEIVSHSYDRPENTNIFEDFERGTINSNTSASRMVSGQQYYPTGIHVEEYNGSKVLMFKNVNAGYFGTKHQYSNFEVSFDVPYILHENMEGEEGVVTSKKHTAFVLGMGDDSIDYLTHGYTSSAEALCFTPDRVYVLDNAACFADLTDKNYFNKDMNEGYSVKVSVIDTQVVVSMKSLHADKYEEVMKYKLGNEMPLGYVHIFTNGQSYFAIDNFRIENKDKDAQLVELEYKESFLKGTQDWEYKPMKAEYLKQSETDNGFDWIMVPVIAGTVGLLFIIFSIVIVNHGKKPHKKEETPNEK